MRIFLAVWSALWTLALPVIWLCRLWRGEGRAKAAAAGNRQTGGIWLHLPQADLVAVAAPMVQALLAGGEAVMLTFGSAATRRVIAERFAPQIAAGQVASVAVPPELNWCFKRFFRAFQPRLGLVVETGIRPRLVQAAQDQGVPLFLCNARYPLEAMLRDRKFPLRPAVMRRLTGVLATSALQKSRFAAFGIETIHVTGELRFDLLLGLGLTAAELRSNAAGLRPRLAGDRPVIAFFAVAEAEEDLVLAAIAASYAGTDPSAAPVFVLNPQAPRRSDDLADDLAEVLTAAGLVVAGDAAVSDAAGGVLKEVDVLLVEGAEAMMLCLAMADRVVLGGGFSARGSHDLITPLALGKPVVLGPDIAGIEYPAVEAVAAGLCKQVLPGDLAAHLTPEGWAGPAPEAIAAFLATQSNATARSLAALAPWLRR